MRIYCAICMRVLPTCELLLLIANCNPYLSMIILIFTPCNSFGRYRLSDLWTCAKTQSEYFTPFFFCSFLSLRTFYNFRKTRNSRERQHVMKYNREFYAQCDRCGCCKTPTYLPTDVRVSQIDRSWLACSSCVIALDFLWKRFHTVKANDRSQSRDALTFTVRKSWSYSRSRFVRTTRFYIAR